MKKISLFILAIALTITSCKNYDDDFKELNASIAELQAQVAGFSAVQTNIAALQASMASLTTAVASIPTTQVDISGLTSGLAASNASIAALQAQLAATNVTIAALQTQLAGIVANYATTGDVAATTAAIANLAAQIVFIQDDIAEILAANNIYDEDLNITNSSELEFAVGLGNKVAVVNGKVTIKTTGLTVAEVATLATVTSKIYSIVGNSTGALDINATKNVDFSNLASAGKNVTVISSAAAVVNLAALTTVTGNYSVTGVDAMDDALKTVTGAVTLDYDGGYEQPNLESAASVTLTNFATVTGTSLGTLKVNFIKLITANLQTAAAAANTAVFTVATSVIVNKGVKDLTATLATDVQVWAANNTGGLTISAPKAGSVITIAGRVDDAAATPAGLALSVTGSTTSVINAANVTKVSSLYAKGATVDFSKLASVVNAVPTSGTLEFVSATNVALPLLTTVSGAFTALSATVLSAPSLVAPSVTLGTAAKTVSLASTSALTAAGVETLTFSALVSPLDLTLGFVALKVLNVTGKAAAVASATSNAVTVNSAAVTGNVALTTVSLNGTISAASLLGGSSATDKLTSVSTAGSINEFTLENQGGIVSLSLAHSHIAGGIGSFLYIINNDKLASLTTSTNYLRDLIVMDNLVLASMNFASYVNVVSTGAINIHIYNNKLTGNFTPAVAVTGTTPYVEAKITSASLATLKPFIAAYKAAIAGASPASTATMGEYISPSAAGSGTYEPGSLFVNMKDVSATTTPQTLAAAMTANAAISTVINDGEDIDGAGLGNDLGVAGIDVVAEFLLIQ